MEDDENENIATCPKKLNFNARFLSTRRLANLNTNNNTNQLSYTNQQDYSNSCNTSSIDRIPFSWEQAPGKPRFVNTRQNSHDNVEDITPRLKLPPSWSCPPRETQLNDDNDDGCDGDVDDDNYDDNDDGGEEVIGYRDYDTSSLDEMDVFSLSEAIDIVERSQKFEKQKNHSLKQKLEESKNEYQSPNFIIQRFLPDATALAASSASLNSFNQSCSTNKTETSEAQPVVHSHSYSSDPKGCGFQVFLPNWHMKSRICGIKSPVKLSHRHIVKHNSKH